MAYTIEQIKAANAAGGFYFFSRDTMRFFKSRVSETVYSGPSGVFFVTSEQFENRSTGFVDKRYYSVREFNPATGEVRTYSTFSRVETSRQAHKIARLAANRDLSERLDG